MSLSKTNKYNHTEHIFRFAAWSASTAARASFNCIFKVKVGSAILKDSNLYKYSNSFQYLPEPKKFDAEHKKICEKIIKSSENYKISGKFTHGIAAKLLNCYFKSIYLIQFQSSLDKNTQSKVDAIHPPIDRVLLTALSKDKNEKLKERDEFWRDKAKKGWSNFDYYEYETVIKKIKEVQKEKDEPLWMIEYAWQGYQ